MNVIKKCNVVMLVVLCFIIPHSASAVPPSVTKKIVEAIQEWLKKSDDAAAGAVMGGATNPATHAITRTESSQECELSESDQEIWLDMIFDSRVTPEEADAFYVSAADCKE